MSDLLARHAEAFFWLARYIERSTSLTRLLEVNASSIDRGRTGVEWKWIIELYADQEQFLTREIEPTSHDIVGFYTLDPDNPGSIKSSMRAARENARTLRSLISAEMWSHLNVSYKHLSALSAEDFEETRINRTCDVIRQSFYDVEGVGEATICRDETWRFYQLGKMIERADQTSRIVDMRFAMAAKQMAGAGLSQSNFWSLILRSLGADDAFRRSHSGETRGAQVARFLILNPYFPRSIAYCVSEIGHRLTELQTTFDVPGTNATLRQVDALLERLSSATGDPRLAEELHEFNAWVQYKLVKISDELSYAFFGMPRPGKKSVMHELPLSHGIH